MALRGNSPHWREDPLPTDAAGVVVQVTDILRDYLATDSRFTSEIAVDRVRTLVNSHAGMVAFVNDTLQPHREAADAVVAKLAAALDRPDQHPDSTVLQLIDGIESPLAAEVYASHATATAPTDADRGQ